LENKPELLEEWKEIALSDILGRRLMEDGQFIPIESVGFREALRLG